MLPERSHWVALGAMGVAVLVQGMLDVAAGTPPVRAGVTIISGLLLVGSGTVGFVRFRGPTEEMASPLVRAVAVMGALVYVGITLVRVVQ
jgi:hypothetical protein